MTDPKEQSWIERNGSSQWRVSERIILSPEEEKEAEHKLNDLLLNHSGADIEKLLDAYFLCVHLHQGDELDFEDRHFYIEKYTLPFLEEVLERLKITNNEHRLWMTLTIIDAAYNYEANQHRLENKQSIKEYKASMRRLSNALAKAMKEIDPDVDPDGKKYFYQRSFTNAFKEHVSKIIEADEIICNEVPLLRVVDQQIYLASSEIGFFLDLMLETARAQEQDPQIQSQNYESPLQLWVNNICFYIREIVGLSIKTPKYYRDIGYISDEIKLLEDLILPIDNTVTNSNLGYTLKSFLSNDGHIKLDNWD